MLVQDHDGFLFQPAGIFKYLEELKQGANKDMGPKDFLGMACSQINGHFIFMSFGCNLPVEIKYIGKMLRR